MESLIGSPWFFIEADVLTFFLCIVSMYSHTLKKYNWEHSFPIVLYFFLSFAHYLGDVPYHCMWICIIFIDVPLFISLFSFWYSLDGFSIFLFYHWRWAHMRPITLSTVLQSIQRWIVQSLILRVKKLDQNYIWSSKWRREASWENALGAWTWFRSATFQAGISLCGWC